MPFAHAKKIVKKLSDAQQYRPDPESRTYRCEVLEDTDRKYVAQCRVREGAWDYMVTEDTINSDNSVYTLDANLKGGSHITTFECENSKGSRKKCEARFIRPLSVRKSTDGHWQDLVFPQMKKTIYSFGRTESFRRSDDLFDMDITIVAGKRRKPETVVWFRSNTRGTDVPELGRDLRV